MSEYVQRFFNRFRGGGLFSNQDLGSDYDGNPYVIADYEGSYLVGMKLQDIATMLNRVKKWKITVEIEVSDGVSTDTISTTMTTPSTVYENAYGQDTGSGYSFTSSTGEIADERALNIFNQRPFETIRLGYDPTASNGLDFTFSWGNAGSSSIDYWLQTMAGISDALEVKPNTPIYLPLSIVGSYYDDSFSVFGDSISFDITSNISSTATDHLRADLNKQTGAVNLKLMGVDVTSDIYWIERNGETGYTFTINITIEPAATDGYWTYDGKFNTDTGAVV